ncbi:MAG TPA: glycosyltransferase [Bacteroidales bacterium]|jgi:cellulose synthase/poly-beta-1,6-N-acetylglucosamine synthase-like glycosyltransferase|nr:glycosyltransferase [Bacteroidales bacterium]HOX73354.1 glycosyltransferase [Bacteroidales bacterium]HPM89076.1 glycosyltransferase [Bacteroidales bacterium]HQM69777.1 glycosyltransferase [Bacteroidales bacterium]
MHWIILGLFIPYIYILLKVYRNLLRIKPYSSPASPQTFVTIIVPCRNEEINIRELLGLIALQDYPRESFEVLVVDDNSGDSTRSVATGFTGLPGLRVIENEGRGKKAAIRAGVRQASGNLIITVDADSRMERSWLKTIVSFYEQEIPGMIICPVKLSGDRSFFARFQELEFLSLQGITAGSATAGNPVMCNGANLGFTKKAYEDHSKDLHEELISGDDIFLLHSVKHDKTVRILWLESENATVTTKTSPSIASYLSQRARWISKAGAYSDKSTRMLALATLTVVLFQFSTLVLGIFSMNSLILFAAGYVLKSVPDYLILNNTSARYGKRSLMRWFFISQLVYPLYVLVVISAFIAGKNRNG